MSFYSVYDQSTGLFTGQQLGMPAGIAAAHIKPGQALIEGRHDHRNKRLDLGTLQVVDHVPTSPSPDHVWDTVTQTWLYVPPPLEVCLLNRRAAYPSLTVLADALYWQSKGDQTKMDVYIAACSEVKQKFPKPV